jgi:hypothetical protein
VKFHALNRPLSIESVRDGGAYLLPAEVTLAETNLFLKVGHVDDLFIKIPSDRGIADYRKFVKLGPENASDIRSIEEAERFVNLAPTIDSFPDLKPIVAEDPELAHYLAVHKLQYQRLRTQTAVGIPEARFGVLRLTRFFGRTQPALFQERIAGTTLWQMFDFAALRVTSRWRSYLPVISGQLSNLLSSPLVNHIDWNIQNFVFNPTGERLFYVDSKPTLLLAKESNELNLKGIRDHFGA